MSSSSLAGSRWLMGMGIVIALAGGIFAVVLATAWLRVRETQAWQAVPCQILSSQVVRVQKTPSSPTVYEVQVRYAYELAGRRYTGQRIRRVDGPSSDADKAERVRQQYRCGQQSECYVMPGQPDFAILQRGSAAALYAVWFPLLFVVGGGVMAWSAWRKMRYA
jgi:hypothetical protein